MWKKSRGLSESTNIILKISQFKLEISAVEDGRATAVFVRPWDIHGILFFEFYPFFSPISWYPIVVVATILSHCYNSRTGSGETKAVMRPPCFLTQRASNPEASRTNVSEETLCTWQPWLARTAPGLPQESLVREETRTSLPGNPSLTRATLGQLCVAPRTSRSLPVTTEPGRDPSLWWHSWRCIIYCEHLTVLCCNSVMIGQICKPSRKMRGIVDFAKMYCDHRITKSYRDWPMDISSLNIIRSCQRLKGQSDPWALGSDQWEIWHYRIPYRLSVYCFALLYSSACFYISTVHWDSSPWVASQTNWIEQDISYRLTNNCTA